MTWAFPDLYLSSLDQMRCFWTEVYFLSAWLNWCCFLCCDRAQVGLISSLDLQRCLKGEWMMTTITIMVMRDDKCPNDNLFDLPLNLPFSLPLVPSESPPTLLLLRRKITTLLINTHAGKKSHPAAGFHPTHTAHSCSGVLPLSKIKLGEVKCWRRVYNLGANLYIDDDKYSLRWLFLLGNMPEVRPWRHQ